MNLESLIERKNVLAGNIDQVTQNLYMLHGHKMEVEYQIQQLSNPQDDGAILEPQPVANDECVVVDC